jgi:oligoribonuclease NrnB/cAMP/cGMP phosphodiesterase (DHH superfamily)
MELIIYDRVDWDGCTAGAVALRAFPHADLLGWTYNDPLPNVDGYDKVILVDLTIYEQNNGGRNYKWMHDHAEKLVWIDHHSSTIQEVNNPDIPGLRLEKDPGAEENRGACMLAWEYFFPNEIVPNHVRLCAVYDVFNKTNQIADWEDAWLYQLHLDQYGHGFKDSRDRSKELVQLAAEFLDDEPMVTGEKIIDAIPLEEARAKREEEIFASAEEFVLFGSKAYIIHATGRPAALIRTHQEREECIVFIITGQLPNGKNKVSIRVSDSCDLNADDLARNYVGGGHEKAAGCKMTDQQLQHLKKMKYRISPAAWVCIIAAVIFMLAGFIASLSPDHTALHEAMIGTMTFILFPISPFLGIFLMLFGYHSN